MGVNGIYGLSGSGLDIESMVKVGMMSKQSEYDKMAQKFTKNEWTKAAYLDISSQITTFNMSTLTQYKLSSNMNAKTADSSDTSVVKVTANATAANMSHKVVVDSLSTNAYLIGSKNAMSDILGGNGVSDTSSNKLQDILFANGQHRDAQDVTSTYNQRTISGNTVTYRSNSSDLPVTAVTTDGSGHNRTLTIDYAPTSGESTTYSATDGSTITTTKKVQYTDYASNDGSSNFTLKEITDSVTDTYGDTSSSIRYEIEINGSNAEYTKSTSTTWFDNTTTDTYTSTDGQSTISITRSLLGGNGNVSVSVNDVAAVNYTVSANGTVDIEKTETTTYDNAKMIKKTTADRNGRSTETTVINFTNGPTINATESYTNGSLTSVSATTVAQEEFINNRIVYDAGRGTVSAGLIASTREDVNGYDTAIAFKIGDGKNETDVISFTYGDLANGKTINDLISEINSKANDAGLNVKASYDNNNEIFSLYNSKGGEENKILITAVDTTNDGGASTYAGTVAKNFFNALGLKQSTGDSLLAPSNVPNTANVLRGSDDSDHLTITSLGVTEGISGTNGKIIVDGVEYDNITDNKVTVGGVTYNALSESAKNANGNRVSSTVTISQDVDSIVDKVKSFVESYNKILSSLYEKYDEKGDSNYKPLTQSQKDSMKDEQIEKWEEKAKQGLLYHDSTIGKIINDMRNAISTPIEGSNSKYNSAYSIGISTTGIKGQLVLDETKLKNALAEDSDAAYNVFAKLNSSATSDARTGVVKENGIAQRLGDIFTTATKSIKTRAGSSADITEDSDLNNLLRELQTKMSNFKKLMSSFEDRLYKKYDAMEVALTKLGSQLSFITGGQ